MTTKPLNIRVYRITDYTPNTAMKIGNRACLALAFAALVPGVIMIRSVLKVPAQSEIKNSPQNRVASESQNREAARIAAKNRPFKDKSQVEKARELYGFDPDGFQNAWDRIASTFTPEEDRNLFLRQTALRMVELGHPDEALEAIKKTFGDGETRAGMIGACFSVSNAVNDLNRLYGTLEFDRERQAARAATFECLAHDILAKNGNVKFGSYNLDFLGEDKSEVLSKAAIQYVQEAKFHNPANAEPAFAKIFEMGLPEEVKPRVLAELSEHEPMLAWREYTKMTAGEASPEITRIIGAMVRRDSTEALAQIAGSPGFENQIGPALRLMGQKDSHQPAQWLEQNKAKLTPLQYDHALQGLAELAAEKSN